VHYSLKGRVNDDTCNNNLHLTSIEPKLFCLQHKHAYGHILITAIYLDKMTRLGLKLNKTNDVFV